MIGRESQGEFREKAYDFKSSEPHSVKKNGEDQKVNRSVEPIVAIPGRAAAIRERKEAGIAIWINHNDQRGRGERTGGEKGWHKY